MDTITWGSIIVLGVVIILIVVDYIRHGRKLYKKNIEEVFLLKERGETFLNILVGVYVPALLLMLGWLSDRPIFVGVILICVTSMIVELNCRIFKYKNRIRLLERRKDNSEISEKR